jgi:hypothetical protein
MKTNVLSLFANGIKCILKANQTNHLTFNTVPLMDGLDDKDVYQCSSDTTKDNI